MSKNIGREIYEHPAVIRSIDRIISRYDATDDETAQSLWCRYPWKPGTEPTLFTMESGSHPVIGCIEIYSAIDGRLL